MDRRAASVRGVLVNIFAGITDLAELAELLCTALERTAVAQGAHRGAARRQSRRGGALHSCRAAAGYRGRGSARRGASMRRCRVERGRGMIDQLTRNTPVIVQGATGRTGRVHVQRMLAYGTRIVAGVSTRAGAGDVEGVPVFQDCAAAVAATGSQVSLAMVPPNGALAAVEDALSAGIRLIVTVAEGIPIHEALRIGSMVKQAGATWVGPSTPGLAVPGEMKLGFLPDVSLRPGPLAIMAKSGTLSYETGYRLAAMGIGQSLWVGVGGDPVKGVRFADLLPRSCATSAHAASS